ncbi:MAG: hypothetical protein ACXWMG_03450, partial [Candidatus Limnocylindria bacterium]
MGATTDNSVHDQRSGTLCVGSRAGFDAEATRSVRILGSRTEMVVSGPRDRRIAMIAVMQAGRVSRAQL